MNKPPINPTKPLIDKNLAQSLMNVAISCGGLTLIIWTLGLKVTNLSEVFTNSFVFFLLLSLINIILLSA